MRVEQPARRAFSDAAIRGEQHIRLHVGRVERTATTCGGASESAHGRLETQPAHLTTGTLEARAVQPGYFDAFLAIEGESTDGSASPRRPAARASFFACFNARFSRSACSRARLSTDCGDRAISDTQSGCSRAA